MSDGFPPIPEPPSGSDAVAARRAPLPHRPGGRGCACACLDTFCLAPSVGLSEPWRVVRVESARPAPPRLDNFTQANDAALAGYTAKKRAKLYSTLKLSGMKEAPVQLAIFCDEAPTRAPVSAQAPCPRCAAIRWWARSPNSGSPLAPMGLASAGSRSLIPTACARSNVPKDWALVGYLCVGWPEETATRPNLKQPAGKTAAVPAA